MHSGVQLSSRRRTHLGSTCRPCANQSPRISADAVYVWLHVDVWLFLSQGRCIVVRAASLLLDCLHGTLCRRRCATSLNPNIILPPTQYLSFRQSVCFIITLVTCYFSVRTGNCTIQAYIQQIRTEYGQNDGRTDGWTDDLPWQYRAIGNVAR